MFRAESSTTRSHFNSLSTKIKVLSSHKDELLTIMGTYFERLTTRNETVQSLNTLQQKLVKNA